MCFCLRDTNGQCLSSSEGCTCLKFEHFAANDKSPKTIVLQ